jgi:hypothetical protein
MRLPLRLACSNGSRFNVRLARTAVALATALPACAGTSSRDAGYASPAPTGALHDAGPPGPDATSDAASGAPATDAQDATRGTLDPQASPGGNFDLSIWELQEPVGSPGNPTTIPPASLAAPNGYQDSYFHTDSVDGAMTFWDPENGVTTANSNYPRSELREMNPDGSSANWPVAGTNTLSATVAVTQVPDHVCIGQIHVGTAIEAGLAASTKPLLELYYYANGDVQLGIENDPTGGQTTHTVANVPLGTKFSYAITLSGAGGIITLVVDGQASTFTMPAAFDGYGEYFKAGDYDQSAGTDGTVGATVKFYALQVTHQP